MLYEVCFIYVLNFDFFMSQFDDARSGIHFTVGPKRNLSLGSTRERLISGDSASINMGSLSRSLHHVGSVTSLIRRIFSRDRSNTNTAATQTSTVDVGE